MAKDHPTPTPRPVFVIFRGNGVKTKGDPELDNVVKPAFQNFGEDFCNVKAYHDDGSFAWHVGNLPALEMI